MFTPQFHVQLKKKRLRLGLSQKEAAALCGLERARWCHLELGFRNPTAEELRLFREKFELGRVFTNPARVQQLLRSRGVEVVPRETCYLAQGDRDSRIRYRAALKKYEPLVRGLETHIRRRSDFEFVEFFCHNVQFDSALEVLQTTILLGQGAIPITVAPLQLGHLPHKVVEPQSLAEVGHRPHLALRLDDKIYFLQVSFRCSETVRVDLLIRDNFDWKVVEINGPGHDSSRDLKRMAEVNLPTRWMTERDVVERAQALLNKLRHEGRVAS
jgi:transcriptional regulator with XRE-family HTH domain